jgi:hypothetical protein
MTHEYALEEFLIVVTRGFTGFFQNAVRIRQMFDRRIGYFLRDFNQSGIASGIIKES